MRTGEDDQPHLVVADRMTDHEFAAWSPPAPPVLRQPENWQTHWLAPLLRCATQLRFIDPFFDPDVPAFLKPMRHYLRVAQARRTVGDLRVQVHFASNRKDAEQRGRIVGQRVTDADFARTKLDASERRLQPLLQSGVTMQALAWGVGPTGLRMHNRYVLTEIGGIAVQHGLDRGGLRTETDDLTVLSKEQYECRWSEYRAESRAYNLIDQRTFTGR